MEMEIQKRRFDSEIKALCEFECASKILRSAEEMGYIELDGLIEELMKGGADRRRILISLRSLGISEADLADAFAIAVSHVAGKNGEKQ